MWILSRLHEQGNEIHYISREQTLEQVIPTGVDWVKCSKCGFEYKASVFNQNGVAVGHDIVPCYCKKIPEGEFKHDNQGVEEVSYRPVMKIPIDNLQYVDALKEGQAFLMIEKDGRTWVWDGMIMEG